MKQRPSRAHLCFLLLCSLAASAPAQTVYRIVDANGKVTFSDKPPNERSAVPLGAAAPGDSPGEGNNLPYVLRQAVAKNPVTLYAAKDCAPCANGRNLLQLRGIPYSEKIVATSEDVNALQQLAGDSSIPVLRVGTLNLKGFSEADWTQTLDLAGYPKTSALPAAYRNPPATALATVAAKAPAASATPPAAQPTNPGTPAYPGNKPTKSNPAGIQF